MKERELREVAKCAVCNRPFAAGGLPMFWRVQFRRFGLDIRAAKRQDGLAQFLGGNSALAAIMGPDEDIAIQLGDTIEVTVCETCAAKPISIYELALSE